MTATPEIQAGPPTVAEGAYNLLEVDGLRVGFDTEAGFVRAVDGVSLAIRPGTTVGLVGESGCGKSVTASSILRLVPSPPGRIVGGSIRFEGRDLLALPPGDMSWIRGQEISMIFQDPMTSLNPVFTVERQMVEVLELRFRMDSAPVHPCAARGRPRPRSPSPPGWCRRSNRWRMPPQDGRKHLAACIRKHEI